MEKLILCIVLLTFSICARAGTIPAPSGYVNDYAHMLSNVQTLTLAKQLQDFERQTSNQVVIATFDSLNNEPLESFSVHLAQQWKIGTKEHNNGVLLLIIKNEHKIRIEVGYGLEGVLTDATSSSIIRNQMTPAFKQGDYAAGIQSGTHAILEAIKGEYKADTQAQTSVNWNWLWGTIFIGYLLLCFYSRFGTRPSNDNGFFALLFMLGTLGGGSNRNDRDSDDSSGGFSGGGGSFGGGGASGSW